ncbi:MAG: glycosyltransferase family 4 protein [Waterburya sp.]
MKYHIPLTKFNDIAEQKKRSLEAQEQKRSRNDVWMLGERLNATFYEPKSDSASFFDKLQGKITGVPHYWEYARQITSGLGQDDVIFGEGEQLGIAIAAVAGSQKNRPKTLVHFHNINRPRGRLSLSLYRVADKIDLFIAHSRAQLDFLRDYLQLPESKLGYLCYPTDCKFFTPGEPSPNKTRPLIVSVGIELRDYRLLATATENLDVDVKIAGFSQFTTRLADNFPETLPANMSNRSYTLSELLQLYHDADVVVVCIQPSNWSAGATALVEAMACRKPIVVTQTEGLKEYVADSDAFISIEPEDAQGLQQAIAHLLNNPQEAEERAEKAYQLALQRHPVEQYVETIATWMENINQ